MVGLTPFSRIIVFGAGALGSVLGARLAGQAPTILIGRSEHVQIIKRKGLEVCGKIPSRIIPPEALIALSHPNEIEPPPSSSDLILLTVKAGSVSAALDDLAFHLPTQAQIPVIGFQNGTGFEGGLFRSREGRIKVSQGVSHLGANGLGPGRVEDWGGYLEVAEDPVGIGLAQICKAAGLKVEVLRDLEKARWKKIAFNCALNPLAGIFGVRNRELIRPELEGIQKEVLREVARMAEVRGRSIPALDELWAEFTRLAAASNNLNSMIQDLRQRRKTEIPFLCRAVADWTASLGSLAPANVLLAESIEALEVARDPGPLAQRIQAYLLRPGPSRVIP